MKRLRLFSTVSDVRFWVGVRGCRLRGQAAHLGRQGLESGLVHRTKRYA